MTKRKETKNLWKNDFNLKELRLYKTLNDKDIEVIELFQKRLPVLWISEGTIEARVLHEQLKVGKMYTHWIKDRIAKYGFEEEVDYFTSCQKRQVANGGYKEVKEYTLTLEMAKQLCMLQNNELGIISRKYFIAIEKAFKERTVWNTNRQASVDTFFDLKKVIMKDLHSNNILAKYLPIWFSIVDNNTGRKNTLAYEMYLIDKVIIKMSSADYRKLKNLDSKAIIRNTFSKQQLADFEMLQSKSAEYIIVQGIWDTNERFKLLEKFYDYEKSKRINNVA